MEVEEETKRGEPAHHLDESGLNQTGFLLAKLRELREWQKEQEDRLLREQKRQMEEVLMKRGEIGEVDRDGGDDGEDYVESDDATIDQELSSLTSYEEPAAESKAATSLSSVEDVTAGRVHGKPDFPPRFSNNDAVPSWAANADSDDEELPRTVFERKSATTALDEDDYGDRDSSSREEEAESRPVGREISPLEEKPILGCKKTFEELLAERLAAEGDSHDTESPSTPAFVRSSRAAVFLRKGSGLRRYKGAGSPPKTFKRSRSQGNCAATVIPAVNGNKAKFKSSTSCSKLDAALAKKSPVVKKSAVRVPTAGGKGQEPGSGGNYKSPKPGKLAPKNRLGVPRPKAISIKKISGSSAAANGDCGDEDASPVYDSVEWSFREKLKKAEKKHKKELEELAAFEMLEEAADGSSFCSSSSKVKNLITSTDVMPSPIAKSNMASSTPKRNGPHSSNLNGNGKEEVEEESIGHTLMNDIQNFLERKGAIVTGTNGVDKNGGDSSDDEEEEEDDTLQDDELGLCLPKDDDHNTGVGGKEKTVRFGSVNGGVGRREDFSPPRIPKNSPSYLIWSIFTKEREERRRDREQSRRKEEKSPKDLNSRSRSPLSQMPPHSVAYAAADADFHATLLNAKLAELEKEVAHFQKESSALAVGRRRLASDRKRLTDEVSEFEKRREAERKRTEEEKRRARRDRMLLEKATRDKKGVEGKKAAEEIEELHNKLTKVQDELHRKESKYSASLSKLQEQVKFLERENQHLHEENHKLKLRGVTSKISTSFKGGLNSLKETNLDAVADHRMMQPSTTSSPAASASSKHSACTLDSGFRSNLENNNGNGNSNAAPSGGVAEVSNKEQMTSPRLASFSPADSLDSNLTLVSGVGNVNNANSNAAAVTLISSVERNGGGKNPAVEKTFSDGSVEIVYANGNRKTVSSDGGSVRVFYYNGDVKETLQASGLVKYFYSQTGTWHLTYPDKREVLQFQNGQEEVRYPDGNLQISFADGSVKKISADGAEDMSFTDGTRVEVKPNGDRTLRLLNGQIEVHTTEYKRREYPDGTVKTLFNDGRQETRYANGRTRVKDKDGNLVHDSASNGSGSGLNAAAIPTNARA